MIKNVKYRQYAASLLAIMSLFASSITACACSHHTETTEIEASSCHSHNAAQKSEHSHHEDSAETIQTNISEDECVCFESAPKTFAKSENIKIEKQALNVSTFAQIDVQFVARTFSFESNFIQPEYLSDSFHNLTPGRAPPVS
jgi:hypothetical protein